MFAHVFKAGFDPSQERDENGRWTFSDRGTFKNFIERLQVPDGGFSYQPLLKSEPKEGFILSVYPERSEAFDLKSIKPSDLIRYMKKQRDLVGAKTDHYFGGWHDPGTGKVALDVSLIVKDETEAHKLAMKHDQKAFFDLKQGKVIMVNPNATSGGVLKGDKHGNRSKSNFAFAFGSGFQGLGDDLGVLQKADREGTDSRGNRGSSGGVEEGGLIPPSSFSDFLELVSKFEVEEVRKYNDSHYPAGTEGGKGGQFAPKEGGGVEGGGGGKIPPLSERKAGDIALDPETGQPAWNPPLNPEIERELEHRGLLSGEPQKGEMARDILGVHKDTQAMHTVRGGKPGLQYTEERSRLHAQIIEKFISGYGEDGKFATITRPDVPTAIFMAGGSAAGKSTALRTLGNLNAVVINPDLIKKELPEYQDMMRSLDPYAAWGTHEESSDIAKEIMRQAQRLGLNVLVDGTGDSSKDKFVGKIRDAKGKGYLTRVVMVDLPTNIAVERAFKRADTPTIKDRDGNLIPNPEYGRYLPKSVIDEAHKGAAARHHEWKNNSSVDSWEIWSNNFPDGGKKIAVGGYNQKPKIINANEYNRILNKGIGA